MFVFKPTVRVMNTEQLIEIAKKEEISKDFFYHLNLLLYQEKFNELQQILASCAESHRQDEWLILSAKCLINQKSYSLAVSVLHRVAISKTNIKIFASLIKCYEQLNMFNDAILLIAEQLELKFKPSLLFKQLDIYFLDNRFEEALTIIEEHLPTLHINQEFQVRHAQCLSALDSPHFAMTMSAYNERNPENVQLWMVQFWHHFKHNKKKIACALLMKVIHMFPVCIEAQLSLIKLHIANGPIINAKLNVLFYEFMFKSNERSMMLLSNLLDKHPELIMERIGAIKVELPEVAQFVFASLNVPGVSSALMVGSAIHQLLKNKSIAEVEDIDFVANNPPAPISGFTPNGKVPNLFNKFFQHKGLNYRCDCFVSPLASKVMIESDVLKRDFTVNGLYCDSEGNIIDPTGLGMLDLQHGIIRTIISSRISINQDPIRILRAIKLILKGLRPTVELEYAIFNWEPQTPLNNGHINAVCAKLITAYSAERILFYLQRFKLLEKMFALNTQRLDEKEILSRFLLQIDSTSPKMRGNKLR